MKITVNRLCYNLRLVEALSFLKIKIHCPLIMFNSKLKEFKETQKCIKIKTII